MYIEIYDGSFNHIANVRDIKYNVTRRVFDLDTSNFEGICDTDISQGFIFVLCNKGGEYVYSGFVKDLKRDGMKVIFRGEDFKKIFDTEVLLDFSNYPGTNVTNMTILFDFISYRVLKQYIGTPLYDRIEIEEITKLLPDITLINNSIGQVIITSASRYLKTYLAYFQYHIKTLFDRNLKKINISFNLVNNEKDIKLEDFVFDISLTDIGINSAITTLKFNTAVEGEKAWVSSGFSYWEYQQPNNRGESEPQNKILPLIDANDYPFGYAYRTYFQPSPGEAMLINDYQVSNAYIKRPLSLPYKIYFLGKDNNIYEEGAIAEENRIYPLITKIFEADFINEAQAAAISELANSRYNENIIITASETPIDLTKVELYTMFNVYDSAGNIKQLPVSEIEMTNNETKLKLGFKKTLLTEVIKK